MPISIIQDTDRSFTVRIVLQESQEPFDLTGITGTNLTMKLTGEDNPVVLTEGAGLTVLSALGGKIQATLTAAQTLLLKARDGQDIEIYITDLSSDKHKVQLAGELNVSPCLFEA